MTRHRKVSDQLRAAEREVDTAYKSNRLIQLPRSLAIWYFLAECEERYLRLFDPSSPAPIYQQVSAFPDVLIHLAKWPMRWLWSDCRRSGPFSVGYRRDLYDAANDLAELGAKYVDYETVFSYASRGILNLELDGRTIRTAGRLREDTRWDAYDRLVDATEEPISKELSNPIDEIFSIVASKVTVYRNRFKYPLNKDMFSRALAAAGPVLDRLCRFPLDWKLTHYDIGEYLAVLKSIWILSCIHFVARFAAAMQGCEGRGYTLGPIILNQTALVNRLSEYTGLRRRIVRDIFADLTFGGGGMANPDIALQPLVPIDDIQCMWSPCIVMSSALERNLLILMNRLPSGRSAYSLLSGRCESLLRDSFRDGLAHTDLRLWSGNVPNWGGAADIDLAIIDDRDSCCLLLELKSFIGPADPREVFQKTQEIERGVRQIQRRRERLSTDRQSLDQVLGINEVYSIGFAVVSETSVGLSVVQVEDVPVIRSTHLISHIRQGRRLGEVWEWLSTGSYLPTRERATEKDQ